MQKEKTLLKAISTKTSFEDIKGEEFVVEIAFTKNQLEEVKKFGLDLQFKMQEVVMKDRDVTITKMILDHIKENTITTDSQISSHIELAGYLDEILNTKKILITNSNVGMRIQDLFRFVKRKDNQFALNNEPYYIGNYLNIQIFIDPNRNWDHNEILTFDNNISLTLIENSTSNEIVQSNENLLISKLKHKEEIIIESSDLNSQIILVNDF